MTAGTHRHRDAGGFLLAEMLTTFTISAFVLASLAALSSLLLRSVDRSVARIERADDLGRTLELIRRDVETAARARFAGPEPSAFLLNGDGSRVMFADAGQNDRLPTRVVALKSDTAGRLVEADAPLGVNVSGLNDLHFGPVRVIYAGPARIRFAYLAAIRSGTSEDRLAAWPVGTSMPAGLIVEAVDPETGRVLVSIRATLRANADLGCLDDGFCGRPDRPAKAAPKAAASLPAPANGPAATPGTL